MLSRKENLNLQGEVVLWNEAIERVPKTKVLSVIVDQHLNWKDHISVVSHKISKSLWHNITHSEYFKYEINKIDLF